MNQAEDVIGTSSENDEIDIDCLRTECHEMEVMDDGCLETGTGNQVFECLEKDKTSSENSNSCHDAEISGKCDKFPQVFEKSDKELSIPTVTDVNIYAVQSSKGENETPLSNEPALEIIGSCSYIAGLDAINDEHTILCSDNDDVPGKSETKDNCLEFVHEKINDDTGSNSAMFVPCHKTEETPGNVEHKNNLKDITSKTISKISTEHFTAKQSIDKCNASSDIILEKIDKVKLDGSNDDLEGSSASAELTYEIDEEPCQKKEAYVCGAFSEDGDYMEEGLKFKGNEKFISSAHVDSEALRDNVIDNEKLTLVECVEKENLCNQNVSALHCNYINFRQGIVDLNSVSLSENLEIAKGVRHHDVVVENFKCKESELVTNNVELNYSELSCFETESNLPKNVISSKRIIESAEKVEVNDDLELGDYNSDQESIEFRKSDLSHNSNEIHPEACKQDSDMNELHKERKELEDKPACAIEHLAKDYKKIRINLKDLPESSSISEENKVQISSTMLSNVVDEKNPCNEVPIENLLITNIDFNEITKVNSDDNVSCLNASDLPDVLLFKRECDPSNDYLLPVNLDKIDGNTDVNLSLKDSKLLFNASAQNKTAVVGKPKGVENVLAEKNLVLSEASFPNLHNEVLGEESDLHTSPKKLELDLLYSHEERGPQPNENDEINNLPSLQIDNVRNNEAIPNKLHGCEGEIENNLCVDFAISEQYIKADEKLTDHKKLEPGSFEMDQESAGNDVIDLAGNNKEIAQGELRSDCHQILDLYMNEVSIDMDSKVLEESPSCATVQLEKSQRKIVINLQRLPDSFIYRDYKILLPSSVQTGCTDASNESAIEGSNLKALQRKRGRRKSKLRFSPRKIAKRGKTNIHPLNYTESSDIGTEENSEVLEETATCSNDMKNVNIYDSEGFLFPNEETSKMLSYSHSVKGGKETNKEQIIIEYMQDRDIKISVNDECNTAVNASLSPDLSNDSLSKIEENAEGVDDISVLNYEDSIDSDKLNTDSEIISKVCDEEISSIHEDTTPELLCSQGKLHMAINEEIISDVQHIPVPDKTFNEVVDLNIECAVNSDDIPKVSHQIVDPEEPSLSLNSFSMDCVQDNKIYVDSNQDTVDNFQESITNKEPLQLKSPISESPYDTDLNEQELKVCDELVTVKAEKDIPGKDLEMQVEEDDIVILPVKSLDSKDVPLIDLEQTDDDEHPYEKNKSVNDPNDGVSISVKQCNLNLDYEESDNDSDNDSGNEFNECIDISKFLVNYEVNGNVLSKKIDNSDNDSDIDNPIECNEEVETTVSGMSYLKGYKDNDRREGDFEKAKVDNSLYNDAHLETVSKNDSLTAFSHQAMFLKCKIDDELEINSLSNISGTEKDCCISDMEPVEQFESSTAEGNSEKSGKQEIPQDDSKITLEENVESNNEQNIMIESVVDDLNNVNVEDSLVKGSGKYIEKINSDGLAPSKMEFFFEKTGIDHQHGLYKRVVIIGDYFINKISSSWPLESEIKPYFLSAENLSMYQFNKNVPDHHFLKNCDGKILVVAVVGMNDIFRTENMKSSNCYPKHSSFKTFGKPFGPDYPNDGPYEYGEVLLNGKVKIESKLPNVYLVYSYIPIVNINEAGKKLFYEFKHKLQKCSCTFNPTRSEVKKIETESESLIETLNHIIFTNRMTQLIDKRFFNFTPLAIEYYNKNWTTGNDEGIILNAIELENSLHLVLYGKKSDCKILYYKTPNQIPENTIASSIKDKFNVYIIGDSWLKAIFGNWSMESFSKPKFYFDYYMTLKKLKKLILSLTENDLSNVLIITSVFFHDFIEYKSYQGCSNHEPLSFPIPKAEMNEKPLSFITDIMKSIDDIVTEVYKRRKNLKIVFMTCYPLLFEFYYKYLTETHEFNTRHEILERLVSCRDCLIFNTCVKRSLKRINQFIIQRNLEINSHTCDIYSLMTKLINVDKFIFPVYIQHKNPSAFLAEKLVLLIKEYVSSMYMLSKSGKFFFVNEAYNESLNDESYKPDDEDESEIFPHKFTNLTIELKTADDSRQISTTTAGVKSIGVSQFLREIKNTSSERTSDSIGSNHSHNESKKKHDKESHDKKLTPVARNDAHGKRVRNKDSHEDENKCKRSEEHVGNYAIGIGSNSKVQDDLYESPVLETAVNSISSAPSDKKDHRLVYVYSKREELSKNRYSSYSEDKHKRHSGRSRAHRSRSHDQSKRSKSRSRSRRKRLRSKSRSRSGKRGHRSRSRSTRRSRRSTSRSGKRMHRSRSEKRQRHSKSRSRRYYRSRSRSRKHYRSRSRSGQKGSSRSESESRRSRSRSRGKKNKSKNKERSLISKDSGHFSKDNSKKSSKSDKYSKAEDVALKNLWEIHSRECNLYRSNPSVHPDYSRLKRMWIDVMIGQGSNPYSQNLQFEWETYWPNKMESIFNESWEEKKTECLGLLHKPSVSQSSDSSTNSESSSYYSSKRKNKHKRKLKTKKSKISSKSHMREPSVDIIDVSPDGKESICIPVDPNLVTSLARDLKDAKQLSIEDLEAKISQFVMNSQKIQEAEPTKPDSTRSSLQIKLLDVSTILSKLSDRFGALGMSVKVLHEKISRAIKTNEDALKLIDDDAKMLFSLIRDKLNRIIDDKTLTLVQRAIIQEALDRLTPFLIEIEQENTDLPFYGLDLNIIAHVTDGKDIVEVVAFINNALAYKQIYDVPQDELMKIYLAIKDIQIKALRPSKVSANLPSTSQSEQRFLQEKKISGAACNMAASKSGSLSQPLSSAHAAHLHASRSLSYSVPSRGKVLTSEKASKIREHFMTLPMNEKIKKFSDFHNLPFEEKNFLWSHLIELEESDNKLAESLRWMITKNKPK